MRSPLREPLVDGHGRRIGDVRISVTDRCNFRCQYCMPAEGLPWLQRDALLTYEELARVVRVLSEMGVHDVRLTGGEPLVRRELWRLVEAIAAIQASKRTDELIPLCHSLPLTHVDPSIAIDAEAGTVTLVVETRTTDRTGVEMEALVAASVGALTVYDMVKGIEPGVVIEHVELLDKTGGKADFHR